MVHYLRMPPCKEGEKQLSIHVEEFQGNFEEKQIFHQEIKVSLIRHLKRTKERKKLFMYLALQSR